MRLQQLVLVLGAATCKGGHPAIFVAETCGLSGPHVIGRILLRRSVLLRTATLGGQTAIKGNRTFKRRGFRPPGQLIRRPTLGCRGRPISPSTGRPKLLVRKNVHFSLSRIGQERPLKDAEIVFLRRLNWLPTLTAELARYGVGSIDRGQHQAIGPSRRLA